jgi:8-oxo-dGTP pyrophosphatase MutT (NUDIX family)
VNVDRPAPGEELNRTGEPTLPRQAATVILLRGGAEGLEVLLCKRTERARFMGGVWVFPGGAVDASDTTRGEGVTPGTRGEDDTAHRLAALRELREEAGITIEDPRALVKFSRWITPAEVEIRYDTHFFLATLPAAQEPLIDGQELVDFGWFTPRGGLDAHARGEIALVFPTIKHLEQLEGFMSADELLDYAGGREVLPVQPRVILSGEVARVVLPGEPGYENAPS